MYPIDSTVAEIEKYELVVANSRQGIVILKPYGSTY